MSAVEQNTDQAANLRGFLVSVNPRFKGRIQDFLDGIPDVMENFNTLDIGV